MANIAYPIGDSLYLNITNRCTNECSFCIRNKNRQFNNEFDLWLDKEPSVKAIMAAIDDPAKYEQIVFCGYGEPLVRLDIVIAVARALHAMNSALRIRLDTNGTANLFWGRNILPELKGLIDFISVSLNAENAEKYQKICQPMLGIKAYPAIIEFIKEAGRYIRKVEATVVDLPGVNKEACQKVATELGVTFRVRPYYEENYVK